MNINYWFIIIHSHLQCSTKPTKVVQFFFHFLPNWTTLNLTPSYLWTTDFSYPSFAEPMIWLSNTIHIKTILYKPHHWNQVFWDDDLFERVLITGSPTLSTSGNIKGEEVWTYSEIISIEFLNFTHYFMFITFRQSFYISLGNNVTKVWNKMNCYDNPLTLSKGMKHVQELHDYILSLRP